MSASPAPIMLPNAVVMWRDAIATLPEHTPPCRYLSPARWAEIRRAAIDFLDLYGSEAVRLGWTAPELFGVHPEYGTLRLDACGELMVSGHPARGIQADRIVFDRGSGYRTKPGQVYGRVCRKLGYETRNDLCHLGFTLCSPGEAQSRARAAGSARGRSMRRPTRSPCAARAWPRNPGSCAAPC